MKNYLELAPKYLSAHKRKTRLTITSVAMAVALVVGIFSMVDALVKFEKAQVLKDQGNYHILIRNPSPREIQVIGSRIDVQNAGTWKDLGEGTINSENCALTSLDENFAKNINFNLNQGRYPTFKNEIMLEKWFMEKSKPAHKIGDTMTITLPDETVQEFIISGIYNDWGATKAAAIPAVFVSTKMSEQLKTKSSQYFVLFKDGVNITQVEGEIKKTLNIVDDRIGRNEGLLALMMQTKNNIILKMYAIGGVLFFIVLITSVVMIYNTFNISVIERVRQFGILRCIGASQTQIKRLVKREGLSISLRAIPLGVFAGILITFICSAIIKFYNNKLFGDISLINFSAFGIGAGIVIGFLTVFISSLLPAKKAAKVSPVSALNGSGDTNISQKTKRGLLMKIFHAEIVIGISNAVYKKKTLFLISSSIALSIIMFMCFSVIVNPTFLGMKATEVYTPDVSITSSQGIGENIYKKLSTLGGVKRVYGRMSNYVYATFDVTRLTDTYKKEMGPIKTESNGLMVATERSWIVSYDSMQMQWAKKSLMAGGMDENELNAQNGIVAVVKNYRKGELAADASLKVGDAVYIKTATETKEYKVMGVLSSMPYESEKQTLTTFITTQKQFTEITRDITSNYKTIDIQLNKDNQAQTINEIKALVGNSVTLHDIRQLSAEANNSFMTIAVFIYGFVGIIALISILNIINTMNTNITSKTKYLGIMRAIGMSERQLTRMALAEAVVYTVSGCIAGCTLGVLLQKTLMSLLISNWEFPVLQVVLIFIISILAASFSIISPLKRIKARGISEVIGSL
ncbi:ABC transporter permease [Clostridium sp. CM027]|uniref:ABC transporter permease n=1 Tax=Clostridium sp. CM027 TaxID=2849865 RepID=UPI001C6EA54E|nr:ABC transporter permease [Clostridium sp. CM027]MBW9146758.1 ABC transporter permease [Clostridium sp. CM027]UVE41584.1 ABC transporter permease [Clostridium sp. CM027]